MEDEAPQPSLADRLFGAPGWAFHVACGVGALSFLWAASSPAGLDLTGNPFTWLGIACVLSWVIRFVAAASRRTLTSAFLALPLMAGVLAAGVYLEVPQETRWLQAEGGFESALRALPTAQDWEQGAADEIVPGRIGSYRLHGVTRDAAGAAQFHLGGTLDGGNAAFTYLVDGPTAEVRDANPGANFEHLHGNWYVLNP
ncbi:hypothetical protein [Sporichthya sp.]|uniref:hypothetical protein n=1 Tax=Sporichthya sp. TaxID=65475 RepID=UPI0017F0B084|nr:hypothetical protein [Sporichthya sp.]MBA3745466.1 hypothetical protein [Sporichthya sp.]